MEREPCEHPDGKIDEVMSGIFGRSWRTTAFGVLGAAVGLAAVVVPQIPGAPGWIAEALRVAAPIVVGGGLVVAKDGKVHGKK